MLLFCWFCMTKDDILDAFVVLSWHFRTSVCSGPFLSKWQNNPQWHFLYFIPINRIICLSCVFRLNLRALRWSQAMIFFIDEINRNPFLLPNITLGYRIYDTCWTVALSTRTALSVVSQPLRRNSTGACSSPSIPLVIGDSGSSLSIAVSRLLNLFQVPLVRASLCCIFRVSCLLNYCLFLLLCFFYIEYCFKLRYMSCTSLYMNLLWLLISCMCDEPGKTVCAWLGTRR